MADWACAGCRARVAPGAPRCPECPSTEFTKEAEAGMLKINRDGIVSDSAGVREHPGTGEPMTGVEHPADGTMSPLVSSDEPFHVEGGIAGAEGLELLRVPAEGAASEVPAPVVAPEAEAEAPPAAPPAPPRTPPRRPPAVQRE